MKVSDLFAAIESPEFATTVGVASGEALVRSGIEAHPAYQALVAAADNERSVAVRVLKRIQSLAGLAIDPRYEHPDDIALTAYSLVLARKAADLAGLAADLVSGASNTWWAGRLALRVLAETRSSLAATNSQIVRCERLTLVMAAGKSTGSPKRVFYSYLLRNADFDSVAWAVTADATVSGIIRTTWRATGPRSVFLAFATRTASETPAIAASASWRH